MKPETLRGEIQGYARQVQLAGLGVVGKVHKGSVRLFQSLVEEGKQAEARRGEASKIPLVTPLKTLGDKTLAQLVHSNR